MHGEARFVLDLHPGSVLDAGCGTGRVAIELARHGVEVVAVDRDRAMLELARRKAEDVPSLRFVTADLAHLDLGRSFDVVVAAGNVMIFLDEGSEPAVVASLSSHVKPGGHLVAGFSLAGGGLDLERYDELASRCGLEETARFATWSRDPYRGGDYAVSVHRRPAADG